MTTHPSCGATWPEKALNVAHCAACHHTFSSPTAFDKHRTQSGGCKEPAAVGLVNGQRPYDCWSFPPKENGGWYEVDWDA